MQRIMLIGPIGGGKSTLTSLLNGGLDSVHKTVVPEYAGDILDMPGEYIESHVFFGRFLVLASNYNKIGLVIPCKISNFYLPDGFLSMFGNKQTIGIIAKTDLGTKGDIEFCRKLLTNAGVSRCVEVSKNNKDSIRLLQKIIDE